MDMFKQLNETIMERCMEHIRAGNIEKANEYVRQMKDMLDTAIDHIDNLEKSND